MSKQNYRLNEPDVISQVFDQEIVAIHLPSGTYHSVTGSGVDIFFALGAPGTSEPAIVSDLAHKYDAPVEQIERDVASFLSLLSRHSLVVSAASAGAPVSRSSNGVTRLPYQTPELQSHSDLQQLFLIDPVHDVSSAGWPNLPVLEAETVFDVATAPAFQCQIAGAHVIYERFPDETVVVNGATGAYYSLYGPAETVFLLVAQNPTLEEILSALALKYSLAGVDADACVRKYLGQLKSAGVISVLPVAEVAELPRELTVERPASLLPFSTLSFQIFGEVPAPEVGEVTPVRPPVLRSYRLPAENFLMGTAEGGMVVADRDSGYYYSLNEPAATVFELLQGGATVEMLAEALGARYDVPVREITAAVMIFTGNLLRMNVIAADQTDAVQGESTPAPSGEKKPFPGLNITVHRDLVDLMRPMNVANEMEANHTAPPADTAQLVSVLHTYFEQVALRDGIHESSFELGGANLRLRRAGSSGAELETAWSHLHSPGVDSPDLTIHVATGGVSGDFFLCFLFDKLRDSWDAMCGPRGEVLGFHSPEVPVLYHPGPDVLSVLDLRHSAAYYIKRESTALPYWEIGSPFRYILHSWFGARGLQFVHGGGVDAGAGGVLFAGKGGSGKSTTTLLCTRAGMRYAGDDYCLVDPEAATLFSLYSSVKLKGEADLARVPELTGQSLNPDSFEQGGEGKAIYFVSDVWPDRLISRVPLRAIVIPSVSGERDSRLEPCSPCDALLALMPSTVAQLPAANQSDCERLGRLVSRLPAYILHLGTDIAQIPALVRGISG